MFPFITTSVSSSFNRNGRVIGQPTEIGKKTTSRLADLWTPFEPVCKSHQVNHGRHISLPH